MPFLIFSHCFSLVTGFSIILLLLGKNDYTLTMALPKPSTRKKMTNAYFVMAIIATNVSTFMLTSYYFNLSAPTELQQSTAHPAPSQGKPPSEVDLPSPFLEIPFEKREDSQCPNNCTSFLDSSNSCNDMSQCSCGSEFTGADCSFPANVADCAIPDKNDVLEKVNSHYGSGKGKDSYDGIFQAHAHIILASQVIQNRVPGDVVELGVFKGGSASVLVHMFDSCTRKRVWLYDSYEGHPSIDPVKNPGMEHWTGQHVGTLDEAKANVRELNPNVSVENNKRIVWKKGFFNITLKEPLPDSISYLHIDCDWYECHIEALDALYERVAWGGVLIFDDVGVYGFARAGLHEWIRRKNIVPALRSTFGVGGDYGGGSHFWIKGYKGGEDNHKGEPLWPGGAISPVF